MSVIEQLLNAIRIFETQHTKPASCIWLGRNTYHRLYREAEAKAALMATRDMDKFHGIPIFRKDCPEYLEVR